MINLGIIHILDDYQFKDYSLIRKGGGNQPFWTPPGDGRVKPYFFYTNLSDNIFPWLPSLLQSHGVITNV